MINLFKDLRLGAKISLLGAGSVALMAIALVALAAWQSGRYQTLAQREVDELIDADLDHITQGIHNLVQTENEAVQQQINYNLNVARHVLANAGETSLAPETVPWTAINQFDNEPVSVLLPKMLVGGRWLGQNIDPAIETAIVDDVEKLVGDTATIFQRMNEQGDMIRVATTVRDAEGRRAIGSYIPAVNPDGTPNPVIAAVLKGETYRGRAFVVNAWHLTAYESLRDKTGQLVGMLYVGVRQKSVEARVRQAILQTKVGKTGYVYVLGGTGEARGHYIVSKDGERDGEDIWESKDASGRHFIQAMVAKALALKPGEMATERYPWRNIGESAPRWKVARLAYYAPWDWVIGASVYEDELQRYRAVLSAGRWRMSSSMGIAGLAITLLIGLLGGMIAWTIARPVREVTRAAEIIIQGNLDQTVAVRSRDEIGILANTFNYMTDQLRQTMEGLRKSEEKYRVIFENSIEGIFQASFEGRLLSANPAMARILGCGSPEELVASLADIRQQLHVHRKQGEAIFRSILERGAVLGQELEFYRKDHQKIWVSISASVVNDRAGKPVFIEGLITDITQRRQAEAERESLMAALEAKHAELERFTYTISHDLKSPVVTVKAFLGYLARDLAKPDPARVNQDMDYIRNAAEKMALLLDELLKLSRVGRLANPPVESSLQSIVEEARKLVAGRIAERGVEVQVTAGPLVLIGDQPRLVEVFQNLLDNAVKFMGGQPAPRIEVGAESRDDTVVFFVRDNGLGIEPRHQKRLFGLFEKLHPNIEGAGVGLALVKRIVEVHGGRIWVESEGAGRGATFRFTLAKTIQLATTGES